MRAAHTRPPEPRSTLAPAPAPGRPGVPWWPPHEGFWAAGLAVACLWAARSFWGGALELQGERYEWAVYLTLGTLFPALLAGVALAARRRGRAAPLVVAMQWALAIVLSVACTPFLLAGRQRSALVAALVHWALLLLIRRRSGVPLDRTGALLNFALALVAWAAAVRLLWWIPFGPWFVRFWDGAEVPGGVLVGRIASGYRGAVFLGSLVLVTVLHGTRREPPRIDPLQPRWQVWGTHALAAIVFLAASIRADHLFHQSSFHHWGVIIGPAALVRQGGWLYWDIPAQYGFLSTLAIAALPLQSIWQSFFVLNASLVFLSAVFLYALLLRLRSGWLHQIFALLFTLAAVLTIPGWSVNLSGPHAFPATGMFRFFWCYAQLAVLAWYGLRSPYETGGDRKVLWAGCVVWLLGSLWSVESAMFGAAIWLPAYTLIVGQKATARYAERGRAGDVLKWSAGWIVLPPALLLLAVGAVAGFYRATLGVGPDWRGFWEHASSFSGGFFALPVDPAGPFLTLFLVFCAVSTVAAYLLRHAPDQRILGLVVGAWGAFWATSSYFVSRSHPNNAATLAPILAAASVAVLLVLERCRTEREWGQIVRTSLVPVMVVVLVMMLGSVEWVQSLIATPRPFFQRDVTRQLPVLEPQLLALLHSAGAEATQPFVFSIPDPAVAEALREGGMWMNWVNLPPAWPIRTSEGRAVVSPPRAWLPVLPFVLLAPLPPERRQVYMARFAHRARLGGWLVQQRNYPYPAAPWFRDQLLRTHRPTRTYERDGWQLVWFEYAGGSARAR